MMVKPLWSNAFKLAIQSSILTFYLIRARLVLFMIILDSMINSHSDSLIEIIPLMANP